MPPIRILIFTRRHPTLTPAQYKDHYENNHVPLLKQISTSPDGTSTFPISHTRNYIPRDSSNQAVLLMGTGDLDFDCVTEAIYADQAHLERHMMTIADPERVRLREEDEAKFLEAGSVRILKVESEGDV